MNKIQGLLSWCKYHTSGYPNVSISNFTTSWKNGLAFNALLHRFKPELINFHELEPENEYYNNFIAFKTAEAHFGIPSLLDPKDMVALSSPERLSVITYVSQYYNCLKQMNPEGGPNVNKFKNTNNNDNSDLESMSLRQSVTRLTKPKCSLCRDKVYLLERYVADDKLYHRKCYRNLQLNNLDNETEIIGDYLNLYGELKPSMNKNIYVHPLQGTSSNSTAPIIHTYPPVTLTPKSSDEESIESEKDSDSKYDISDSSLPVDEECYSSDESFDNNDNDKFEERTFPDMDSPPKDFSNEHSLVDDRENLVETKVNDIDYLNANTIEKTRALHQKHQDNSVYSKIFSSVPSQENQVLNMEKYRSLKPIKMRLYVKKKDTELPYSTCFELSLPKLVRNDSYIESQSLGSKKSYVSTKEVEDISQITHRCESCDVKNIRRKSQIITDESELESELSIIDNEQVICIRPNIVRNSIWRRPIVSSFSTRKSKSVSVPFEPKFQNYYVFKERLCELNKKQSRIEIRAREVQEKLWTENQESDEFEQLLVEWLKLVEEKDKLFYEENALYSWIKDLKLQETKVKLESEIRILRNESDDNPEKAKIESELIRQLIDTVNKRSQLVDTMHEENIRRREITKMRDEALQCNEEDRETTKHIHLYKKPSLQKNHLKFWKRKLTQ